VDNRGKMMNENTINTNKKISFPVVETFISINGEGQKSGELALFIRFKGCNLKCGYCDTKWANEADASCEQLGVDAICDIINKSNVSNVMLTGGEPLLQENIDVLIEEMLENTNCSIEIETNGSKSIVNWVKHNNRISFTMDYKLPDSGMEKYMDLDNFNYLMENDTVKFVCSSISDMDRAKEIIEKYDLLNKCPVYLGAVFGKIEPADMVEYMKDNQMNGVRLQLQMHKFIWDPMKRGV